jgi:hypothetical protein
MGQQAGQEARDRRAAGDTGASGIAQTLRDSTYRSIDDQKARASDTLGDFAGAVRGMTQPLRDGGQTQIADYVNKAADGIERWASELRQQDLEDAMRAVQQFARRQPAMFLGLAFGAGLVAARFLKSSSETGRTRRYGGDFDTSYGYGSAGAGPAGPRATGFDTPGTSFSSGGTARSTYGTTGSATGDIPRVSSDIRPSGEVL